MRSGSGKPSVAPPPTLCTLNHESKTVEHRPARTRRSGTEHVLQLPKDFLRRYLVQLSQQTKKASFREAADMVQSHLSEFATKDTLHTPRIRPAPRGQGRPQRPADCLVQVIR